MYTRILTIMNGVFNTDKNTLIWGVVSKNILILSLFPKTVCLFSVVKIITVFYIVDRIISKQSFVLLINIRQFYFLLFSSVLFCFMHQQNVFHTKNSEILKPWRNFSSGHEKFNFSQNFHSFIFLTCILYLKETCLYALMYFNFKSLYSLYFYNNSFNLNNNLCEN